MNQRYKIIFPVLGSFAIGFATLTIMLQSSPSTYRAFNQFSQTTSATSTQALKTCSSQSFSGGNCSDEQPPGCSIFTVSKGDQVFFGGNDDYINPDNYYWVDPEGYGAIWIGQPDNVQQGVNSKGLAYDANGLPRFDVNPHLEREPVSDGYSSYPLQILRECATVEEVIEWVNTHQWHSFMQDQLHFADATGDAVVISAGKDGEVAFTRKAPGDSFLVSTNFNLANPVNAGEYPSWRYDTAQELLAGLVAGEGDLTAQDAAGVLDAVHVSGLSGWTLGSIVADLTNGTVYLYYFHQFDDPVILNVAEEIAANPSGKQLSQLFPENVQQEAARRYKAIQDQAFRCQQYGLMWLGLVFASLVILLIAAVKNRRGMVFWIPVVTILGPFGLLIWFATRKKLRTHSRLALLVETVGELTPVVVVFVIFLVLVISTSAVQASQTRQILLLFILPLILALAIFHSPLLASASHLGYLNMAWKRFPHAWVTSNLGMGGLFLLAFPLVNLSLLTCTILPLNPWTLAVWWGLAVVGALVAIIPLLVYEWWAARRGFHAWVVLASGEGEITTPAWRELWWWILLSLVTLLAGIAVGVMIQQALA